MNLIFKCLSRNELDPNFGYNTVYLQPDNWDDYSYKTLFSLYLFDESGKKHELGNTKIGFVSQPEGWTVDEMPESFEALSDKFFSLGQDADFYRAVYEVSHKTAFSVADILGPVRDVGFLDESLRIARECDVFRTSLLRTVDRSSIVQQFRRVLHDEAPLSNYAFRYEREAFDGLSKVCLDFITEPASEPPTNIHILIGRNGVGKTTILNNMVDALISEQSSVGRKGAFYNPQSLFSGAHIRQDYFAGVVSVSFSAFDTFIPPSSSEKHQTGIRYRYVGLKKESHAGHWVLSNHADLGQNCADSLKLCLALKSKRARWLDAVDTLCSDPNFSEMPLTELVQHFDKDSSEKKSGFEAKAKHLFSRMSSGHCIVLLTITSLIETVEEKTLVLIDEPESHLHPPLLSAFTRALSNLLMNRNGIAIVATHSPVVLQEVPKSCVSIINRSGMYARVGRPSIETFAENVGTLTREVFQLEVEKSGFHNLLEEKVRAGGTYESILTEYQNQLGFEGKAVLRSMIHSKDS